MPSETNQSQNQIQGEGNYDAARKFDAEERAFVEKGPVERKAREAERAKRQEDRKALSSDRKASSADRKARLKQLEAKIRELAKEIQALESEDSDEE